MVMTQEYKRIIVAVDVVHEDPQVIKKAAALATAQTQFHLITVMDPVPMDAYAGVAMTQEYVEARQQSAQKKLTEMVTTVGLINATITARTGPVAATILDAAKEFEADLIIVGSHGRHGIRRLIGSTASAVVHEGHCDVLTVRLRE